MRKKTEIIIHIGGGLGNQMFQYALARNISRLNGIDFKLDISSHFNHCDDGRKYELSHFNIVENFATVEEIAGFEKFEKRNGRKNLIHNMFFANRSLYIKEDTSHFNEKILKLNHPAYIFGWWHNERYFKNNEETIRKEFTLRGHQYEKFTQKLKEISKENSVSIHIRRGDNLTDPKVLSYLEPCTLEYYKKASEKMAENIKNPIFYIFSDDTEWAIKNLSLKFPTKFHDPENFQDYEELLLMSACKHNIIANSTFSWWGAWLNKNPQKIIIAPQKWFRDPVRNLQPIVPSEWLRL